jgi:hypothetical protein
MTNRLGKFLQDVSALSAQRNAEQRERLERLKAMTPEQFVRVPREELQYLTGSQYAAIVRHIAPTHRPLEPQAAAKQKSEFWAILHKVTVPTAARAAVLGLLSGFLVWVASVSVSFAIDWWQYRIPPIRSQDASSWPQCPRLNSRVDGCIYEPVQNMAWDRAADLLQIPGTELRQSNRHILETYIPAQSMLVVWRHRSQFKQEL